MSKCAVVLSAYNGEKFIAEQLDSLVSQTRVPDRIYIGDDGSADRTVEIVQHYMDSHPEIQWRLIRNEKNKGWQKNFYDLISGAEEDLIFLCDQDDVWEKNKIAKMSGILEERPEIELLACGYQAWYMDENSHISDKFTQGMNGTGEISRIPMDKKFMYVLRPGCTYGFRRSLFSDIDPYWLEGKAHDAVLWRYSVLRGTAYLLDLPLIRWRRYSSSSSSKYFGAGNESAADIRYRYIMESYESNIRFLPKMLEYCRDCMPGTKEEELISQTLQYLKDYQQALKSGKWNATLKTGIRYRHFFLSWKTPLADTLMTIRRQSNR